MTPFKFDNDKFTINRDWVAQETRAIKRRYEEGYGVDQGQWKRAYDAAMFRATMETDIKQRQHEQQQADRYWAVSVGIEEIERLMDNCDPYSATETAEFWRLKGLAQFVEKNIYA